MSQSPRANHSLRRLILASLLLSLGSPAVWPAAKEKEEPTATSAFPIGVERGTTARVEVRGTSLDGAYEVMTDNTVFVPKIESVEDFELEPAWVPPDYRSQPRPKRRGQRVHLAVEVSRTAPFGPHFFRLVTPQGVSNRLMLLVGSDRIWVETDAPHQSADKAQELQIPAFLNGKIAKDGEVDFYSFNASQGEQLVFEVNPQPPTMYEIFWGKPILDAQLVLYEPTGSWFSKSQVTPLAFSDEPVSARIDTRPRLTYRFPKSGRYLVSVSSFMGRGHADYVYQLSVTPPASSSPTSDLARKLAIDTRFQAFIRKLEADRIERLLERTVRIPEVPEDPGKGRAQDTSKETAVQDPPAIVAATPAKALPLVRKIGGANEVSPLEISVPSLIEGAIESPEEVDSFRFQVVAGKRLAFEIETPEAAPPIFNPKLNVVDGEGHELFSNVYKRIGRERYVKDIEAKTLFTFERAGEYTLQVRNIIPEQQQKKAGENFRYRILIRDQVPHVGAVELHESRPLNANSYWWKFGLVDRINIEIGKAKKLLAISYLEEEFSGNIAVNVLDCPKGIEVLPGTELEANPLPPTDEGKKEQFLPKRSIGTITLLASPDALATRTPQIVRVVFRPIVDGVLGSTLEVAKVPLMVVAARGSD